MTVVERSRPLRVSILDSRLCNSKGGDANVSSRIGSQSYLYDHRRCGVGGDADLEVGWRPGGLLTLWQLALFCTSRG